MAPRLGSYFVLGDWGYDANAHGNVKPECQRAIADAMEAERARLGDVQFVVNVGDSFYPSGVVSSTDVQWASKWSDIYSPALTKLPWLSVYGNHDLGSNDGCGCSDDPRSACRQLERHSASGGWFMPNLTYTCTGPRPNLLPPSSPPLQACHPASQFGRRAS